MKRRLKKRRQKVRNKYFGSVLLSILLVTSLTASLSIAILTTTSPPVSAAGENYIKKENMPDLGQHSKNWCWVAAAANSMYWYSQHGYLQLIDDPENLIPNDNTYITQMIPHPPTPISPLPDSVYRLLQEIAIDCLFPGVPENMENYTIANTWDNGISDNQYFFGLQEFINEQGAALTVHEIVDNTSLANIPPQNDNIVIYRPPTFRDYKERLDNCNDVLLWLNNYRHENTENYPYRFETTDHVLTGVGFGDNWMLVSDPWTTGGPDHNNALDNRVYDNLPVLSAENSPLLVFYFGAPRSVGKLIYVSPTAPVENFKKENMPDLGQHSMNWCWAAAAANSFKWYFHNGYPKLMDDPTDNVLDENYLQLWPCPSGLGDLLPRLLHEIAGDCLYPNVPPENEITITLAMTYCKPIDDNKYFYGLQEFIREQGNQFKVREIIDNSHFAGLPENIPPENDNVVIYDQPTFDNYKSELKLCHDVLLQLNFRNYSYENGTLEGLDHIVTGVSYYDGGPGNQWILVSDPWTPFPGPDHNSLENLYRYENLKVENVDPLTVTYTGYTPGGPIPFPVQVVKLIFISPIVVAENVPENLVSGWNLVHFPVTSENNTPDNILDGQTYYIWRWSAENKKYVSPSSSAPVELGVGYWIWVGYDQTVTTSGVPVNTYSENLKNGWNLVGFPVTSSNTTPDNLFLGQTYYIWRWSAENKKYVSPSSSAPVELKVGYWIWVGYDQTVTVPL